MAFDATHADSRAVPYLETLGTVQLWVSGELVHTGGERETGLLLVLAVENGRQLRRESLINMFWSGGPSPSTRHALRQLLYSLRRRVPTVRFESTAQGIRILPRSIVVDIHNFLHCHAAADHRGAATMYTGDFLPDFGIGLPRAFLDWRDVWSARSALAAVQTLNSVLSLAEDSADWVTAGTTALRLCHLEPSNASYQERAVRAAAILGGAEAVTRTLRIAKPPRRTVARLIAAAGSVLAATRTIGAQDWTTDVPFVGRNAQFSSLKAAFLEAVRRRPSFALVTGEAGIGKTRLCTHFLRFAALNGARVLYVQCVPVFQAQTFSAVLAGIRSSNLRPFFLRLEDVWRKAVAEIVPEWREAADSTDAPNYSLSDYHEALWRLLDAASQERPIVLFFDDFRWADSGTCDFISLISMRPDSALFVLAADRADTDVLAPAASPLDRLMELPRSKSIPLGEMDLPAVNALIDAWETAREARIYDQHRRRLWERVGGRPFLLLEILDGALRGHGGESPRVLSSADLAVTPPNVEALVRSRLKGLSRDALHVLLGVSTATRPCTRRSLRALLSLTGKAVDQAVTELLHARLLRSDDGVVRTSHDTIRDVLRGMVGRSRLSRFHRRWAEVLAQECGGPAAEIAGHLLDAGSGRLAFPYLLEAAETVLATPAFIDAENFLRRAREVAPTAPDTIDASERLLSVLWNGRRFREAHEIGQSLRAEYLQSNQGDRVCRLDALGILAAILEPRSTAEELFGKTRLGAAAMRQRLPAPDFAEILCSIVEMAHEAGQREFLQRFLPSLREEADNMHASPSAAAKVLIVCALATAVYQRCRICCGSCKTCRGAC